MTDIVLRISLHELCQYEYLSEQLIVEVVDHGIAKPVEGQNVENWVFDTVSVRWLQKAARLHSDLEIDWIAVAMVSPTAGHCGKRGRQSGSVSLANDSVAAST